MLHSATMRRRWRQQQLARRFRGRVQKICRRRSRIRCFCSCGHEPRLQRKIAPRSPCWPTRPSQPRTLSRRCCAVSYRRESADESARALLHFAAGQSGRPNDPGRVQSQWQVDAQRRAGAGVAGVPALAAALGPRWPFSAAIISSKLMVPLPSASICARPCMTSSSLGTLPSTTCMNDESSLLSKPFPSWSNAPYAYLTLATCSAVMGMAAAG